MHFSFRRSGMHCCTAGRLRGVTTCRTDRFEAGCDLNAPGSRAAGVGVLAAVARGAGALAGALPGHGPDRRLVLRLEAAPAAGAWLNTACCRRRRLVAPSWRTHASWSLQCDTQYLLLLAWRSWQRQKTGSPSPHLRLVTTLLGAVRRDVFSPTSRQGCSCLQLQQGSC